LIADRLDAPGLCGLVGLAEVVVELALVQAVAALLEDGLVVAAWNNMMAISICGDISGYNGGKYHPNRTIVLLMNKSICIGRYCLH
jgi:hypothetical protein